MDQVTSTIPISLSRPKALHTASDPSTILLSQGGWPACSSSQPRMESHSSTTCANTLLPLLAVILIIFPHLDPPLYHPVDSATIGFELSWYCPSHSDGPPPSPPALKSLFVSLAWVDDVTGGEHLYVGYEFPWHVNVPEGWQFPPPPPSPPLHMCVPKSGSSLHLPLMQMSWPSQSSRVPQGPLHWEIAFEYNGREIVQKKVKREREAKETNDFPMLINKLSWEVR